MFVRADVCVFLSVKFVFIPNIIEVHPSIVSYRRGRGGWLMICGDFYNKHCFKIHTEVAMTPYCFSSTVCLSVQHCRCLFMSMCTCVCECALWILLLVSFIILILQSLQWPLNLLFSAFWHLFLFYLLSFLDSLFCYSVVCVVTLNVHTLHTIGRIDECKYSESCIHTYMCIEKQNRMQTRKLNICTSKC